MPNTIRAGTILIREGAELPKAVRIESAPYMAGWRLVNNLDGYELDRKIHQAGWTSSATQARSKRSLSVGTNKGWFAGQSSESWAKLIWRNSIPWKSRK